MISIFSLPVHACNSFQFFKLFLYNYFNYYNYFYTIRRFIFLEIVFSRAPLDTSHCAEWATLPK